MSTIPLKPERQAQLEEYAQRRGQDPATALDDVLATYLEWERQDFEEAVVGIRKGYEEVKAGRTRSTAEFLAEMRARNMAFRVEITAEAEREEAAILEWLFATRWRNRDSVVCSTR